MKKPLALLGAGISTLTALLPMSAALATGPTVELNAMNMNGGIEISEINEHENTITVMFSGTEEAHDAEYIISKYHFFYGDVSDEELPEMVEGTKEGIKTLARGTDGENIFNRSFMQVSFTPEDGIQVKDNASKVISYAVYIRGTRPGYEDKIIAGRYDYSRCVNSIGYAETEGAFCARDEYAGGESFYTAYNRDWKKLKPAPEIEVVEVEKPVEVEKIVEIEKPVTVEKVVTNTVEVEKLVEGVAQPSGNIASAFYGTRTGNDASNASGVAEDNEEPTVDNISTDSVSTGEEKSTEAGAESEEVLVPELGGSAKSSHLGWLLGLAGLAAIGGLGTLFWFVFPVILPRHRKKDDKKHK